LQPARASRRWRAPFHHLQEITPIAQHNLALKVSTELPVGSVDLELPVKRNGRRIGTFTVNAKGVSWNPATAKAATSVSWDDLPATLAGAPATAAAAPATPAKKASTAKAAPAKRATRKRSASRGNAPQPAAEPAPVAEAAPAATAEPETAAPESGPAATVTTPAPAAETVTKTKTAKKAAAKPAAVNARAAREWAAGNGITIGPRGPIAVHILDQYRAATA